MKKHIMWLFLVIGLGLQAQGSSCKDIYGKVLCDGKGVPGVVVTDGIDCVLTNEQGCYMLEGKRNARFVYLTVPAGYIPPTKQTIPLFYKKIDASQKEYNFELKKNPKNDLKHLFLVQADVQVTSENEVKTYEKVLQDMRLFVDAHQGKQDIFGVDCGDIVGDSPFLYPSYIQAVASLGFPIYRAIGNHDMTYGGRTFEYSYQTFEDYFGPIYYAFNKGKAHYIVLDNCFYVNRDYQYIGYIDERTFLWLEKDLAYVPKGSPVFIIMHIPSSLQKEISYNTLQSDETNNARALHQLLKGYNAHILSGHSHFNLNVCFNDSLMEHNTAAVCGIWWKGNICTDGTPNGYGVYEVDGTDIQWSYKSAGYPIEYQMRTYLPGHSEEYPSDIIVNVWNWDELWRVEWYEDGKKMGEMERFTDYDPEAKTICSNREKVVYDWIIPTKTDHLFRATPKNAKAKIEVKAIDRFGKTYKQIIQQ